MELSHLLDSQYGFHAAIVAAVILCVVLVFILGFKSPQEPEFEKLTDDRKSGSKKKKIKDKKSSANGHVTTNVTEKRQDASKTSSKKDVEKSPAKKQPQEKKSPKTERDQPLKENRDNNGNRKSEKNLNQTKNKESNKGNKENVLNLKNKKNVELDHDDDGEWEQAVSRRDKRSKKSVLEEILPQKNDKKKGKKKMYEEDSADIQQPDTKILDVLNEIGIDAEAAVSVEEKPTATAVATSAAATATKETKKSSKKKKPASSETSGKTDQKLSSAAPISEPETVEPVLAEKTSAPETETPKQAEPKQPRQKKQSEKPPQSGVEAAAVSKSAPEPVEVEVKTQVSSAAPTVAPASDSNVVFDELGDSWKEAKAPKKSSRKKTRVD